MTIDQLRIIADRIVERDGLYAFESGDPLADDDLEITNAFGL